MSCIEIVKLAESHFDALYGVLDAVARERCYLALLQAPVPEEAWAFYRRIVQDDLPHYVALRYVMGRLLAGVMCCLYLGRRVRMWEPWESV